MDVKSTLEHLFDLPKFEEQKKFCQYITQFDGLEEVFEEIIRNWPKVPTNRKDKFFYLISLIIKKIEYDIPSIEITEIRNHCLRNKFILDKRMIEYISKCRYSSTLLTINEMLYPVGEDLRNLALSLGKQKEVEQLNREILYRICRNQ